VGSPEALGALPQGTRGYGIGIQRVSGPYTVRLWLLQSCLWVVLGTIKGLLRGTLLSYYTGELGVFVTAPSPMGTMVYCTGEPLGTRCGHQMSFSAKMLVL
jgi:hypothetical protein